MSASDTTCSACTSGIPIGSGRGRSAAPRWSRVPGLLDVGECSAADAGQGDLAKPHSGESVRWKRIEQLLQRPSEALRCRRRSSMRAAERALTQATFKTSTASAPG